MNHNDFFELIKRSELSGAYLLYGEERFVKDRAIKSCESLIPADMRAFNLTVLVDATMDMVFDACETLPLFADKRLVICHGLAAGIDNDALISYLRSMPESTVFLLDINGALQERSVLLKGFRSMGHDVLFSELSESDVMRWCMKTAAEQGVGLDRNTARTLVALVGTDMTSVSNELKKAIDMVGDGGVITPQTLSLCTVGNIEYQVFEMLDCFIAGKLADGMRALHAILEDEDEALGIAAFLESRFKLMLEGRRLMDGGLNQAAAAAKMEGSRFANNKACAAARKYSSEQLAEMVYKLANVGYNMMTGGIKASRVIEASMLSFKW